MFLMNTLREILRKGYYINPQGNRIKIEKYTKTKLTADIIGAERMVFDKSALDTVAELVFQHPDFLLEFVPRMRLPFNRVWIEYDANYLADAIQRRSGGAPSDNPKPHHIGFVLKNKPNSHIFSMNSINGIDEQVEEVGNLRQLTSLYSLEIDPLDPHFLHTSQAAKHLESYFASGMSKLRHTKNNDHEFIRRSKYNPKTLNEFILHNSSGLIELHTNENTLDEEIKLCHSLLKLFGHARIRMDEYESINNKGGSVSNYLHNNIVSDMVSSEQRYELIEALARDAENIPHSLLLMFSVLITLNMQGQFKDNVTKTVIGPPTQSIKNEYMKHTTVTINLTPNEFVDRLKRDVKFSISVPKKRHTVRGHWCVSRRFGNPDCTNVKQVCKPKIVDANHNECETCGKKEWRKQETMRGDASLGFVTHDYVVVRK